MEQDLFNQIKDAEYEMMDYYRRSYVNSTEEYAPIKHILNPWYDAKSAYLYQLMGNELILEKEIMYKTPISELTDRFHDLKWNNNSVLAKFVTELDRFIWDNRESLGDEYYRINRLADSDVLAANAYPDATFVVHSAEGRVIKVQTGSKPVKMLQKIIKSYPNHNVTSLQDFINIHSCVMNDAKLKGTLCLSIHPLDYMTMSDNQHDWSSCMSWVEEGCYRLGTVEMMNSKSVVVAYLKSNDGTVYKIGNNTWNSKKWRQLIIVDSDFICGVKCYPYRCDELTEMAIKWLMELGSKNMGWNYTDHIFKSNCTEAEYKEDTLVQFNFETTNMYNDFGTTTHLFVLAENFNYIGRYNYVYSGVPECMVCGDCDCDFEDTQYLACTNCDDSCTCYNCGTAMSRDDTYELDGELYCQYCYDCYARYDIITDEYHHEENFNSIIIVPDDYDVSQHDCYDPRLPRFESYTTDGKDWNNYFTNPAHYKYTGFRSNYYIHLSEIKDLEVFYDAFYNELDEYFDSVEEFVNQVNSVKEESEKTPLDIF